MPNFYHHRVYALCVPSLYSIYVQCAQLYHPKYFFFIAYTHISIIPLQHITVGRCTTAYISRERASVHNTHGKLKWEIWKRQFSFIDFPSLYFHSPTTTLSHPPHTLDIANFILFSVFCCSGCCWCCLPVFCYPHFVCVRVVHFWIMKKMWEVDTLDDHIEWCFEGMWQLKNRYKNIWNF